MYEKIVLVTRKTRLDELVERFNTRAQAEFYIERAGGNFKDYLLEHDVYQASLERVRRDIECGLKIQVLDRSLISTYLFSSRDIIITLGQDGLVANTAKYVNGQPIIAVNPDASRFDGVLLPFVPEQVHGLLRDFLSDGCATQSQFGTQSSAQAGTQSSVEFGTQSSAQAGTPCSAQSRIQVKSQPRMQAKSKLARRTVTMAEARLKDGQKLLAFNDLFIGASSHISARYKINFGDSAESQSSSGIIVSTGAGSTGWLSSVFNEARGIMSFFGAPPPQPVAMPWDADKLFFVVREPFVSLHSTASVVVGSIEPRLPLRLESQMPTGGVIFSDGVESDHLDFNSGTIADIHVAEEKANLVMRVAA